MSKFEQENLGRSLQNGRASSFSGVTLKLAGVA